MAVPVIAPAKGMRSFEFEQSKYEFLDGVLPTRMVCVCRKFEFGQGDRCAVYDTRRFLKSLETYPLFLKDSLDRSHTRAHREVRATCFESARGGTVEIRGLGPGGS